MAGVIDDWLWCDRLGGLGNLHPAAAQDRRWRVEADPLQGGQPRPCRSR